MELSNRQHESFAQHVATGFNQSESARRAGYAPSCANNAGARLMQKREIQDRVAELQALNGTRAIGEYVGIRASQARVSAIEDRWNRMRLLMLQRAEDPELQNIPGGKTGLIIKTVLTSGRGDKAVTRTTFALDAELLRQMLAHEEAAAVELGQRQTRSVQLRANMSATGTPSEINKMLHQSVAELRADQRSNVLALAPPDVRDELASELGVSESGTLNPDS